MSRRAASPRQVVSRTANRLSRIGCMRHNRRNETGHAERTRGMDQRRVEGILCVAACVGLFLAGCWGPQSPPPAPPAVGGSQAVTHQTRRPNRPPSARPAKSCSSSWRPTARPRPIRTRASCGWPIARTASPSGRGVAGRGRVRAAGQAVARGVSGDGEMRRPASCERRIEDAGFAQHRWPGGRAARAAAS